MVEELDVEVQALVEKRDFERAATRVLEAYGSEVFGFLVHALSNETHAGDVFSQVGEDLWRGLPAFGFRCSLRTWIYVLARHATSRYRRSPWNQKDRRTGDSRVQSLVEVARSRTSPWQRTEIKDKFSALREQLSEEDRMLLTLRIDRDLAWEDVALVMFDGDAPDAATLKRETDRLRKRFQFVKAELRKRAEEAGLLDESRS